MRLYGICGDSGQGKTRLVSRVLAEAQRLGWRCRGVFSPAVFEDGLKIGIGVKLLPGMQTRVLARLATAGDTQVFGKWKLNLESIAWARAHLLDLQPADLWIIDEIGPLEIVNGQGWADILPLIPGLPAKKVLVTFRKTLSPWFQAHYPEIYITHAGDAEAENLLIESLFRND